MHVSCIYIFHSLLISLLYLIHFVLGGYSPRTFHLHTWIPVKLLYWHSPLSGLLVIALYSLPTTFFLVSYHFLFLCWINTIKKKPQSEYWLKHILSLFLDHIIALGAWKPWWKVLFCILFQGPRLMEVLSFSGAICNSVCATGATFPSLIARILGIMS